MKDLGWREVGKEGGTWGREMEAGFKGVGIGVCSRMGSRMISLIEEASVE